MDAAAVCAVFLKSFCVPRVAMPMIETGFADINGGRTYYEISGSGQPLVFVHGFTLDTRMWDEQFEAFADRYRAVRYDVRGFGKSSLPAGPYAPEDDLKALLDHLGIDKAHIVGLSMGGRIVIDFAVKYPERVASLVPVDAGIGGYNRPNTAATYAKVAAEKGLEAAIDAWMNSPLFAPAVANPPAAAALQRIVSEYSGYRWQNADPLVDLVPPANDRLDKIAAPTLVIVGELDLLDIHVMGKRMEDLIPDARMVIMKGVGHMSNMEDPATFNRILSDFLASL
jgi:pimeloyl-ACP methyl ester carboxylesterase